MAPYIASMPVEKLLAHIKPADRVAGLAPEDRLAGLAPTHAVLALPVEVLRGLAPDSIATLPDDVQAVVRARLAG